MPERVRIVCTRDTCGGAPRIAGTRITTREIYQEWLLDYRDPLVAAGRFGISPRWVEAAIAYERRWYRRLWRVLRGEEP